MHMRNDIHTKHQETSNICKSKRHHITTPDDISTTWTRLSSTSILKSRIKPKTILLQKMGDKWNKTNINSRGAGSSNTVPFNDIITENNNRLHQLPDNHPNTASLISEHKFPRLRWPKPAEDIPEWIKQVAAHLRPYDSYHIYTDGSYKKAAKHMTTSS